MAMISPTPWTAEGYRHSIVNDANGDTLCCMPGNTIEQSIANAALIAAAPDLFEALNSILGYTQPMMLFDRLAVIFPSHVNNISEIDAHRDGLRAALERANEALAKAKGESYE